MCDHEYKSTIPCPEYSKVQCSKHINTHAKATAKLEVASRFLLGCVLGVCQLRLDIMIITYGDSLL